MTDAERALLLKVAASLTGALMGIGADGPAHELLLAMRKVNEERKAADA